jgi:hypothetical protein
MSEYKPNLEYCVETLKEVLDVLENPDTMSESTDVESEIHRIVTRCLNRPIETHYVVFEDGETWISESGAYVVPARFITSYIAEDLDNSDGKVFKNDIPRISVEMLIDALERAGLWDAIVDEAAKQGRVEK